MTRDQGSPGGRAALFKLEIRNEKWWCGAQN